MPDFTLCLECPCRFFRSRIFAFLHIFVIGSGLIMPTDHEGFSFITTLEDQMTTSDMQDALRSYVFGKHKLGSVIVGVGSSDADGLMSRLEADMFERYRLAVYDDYNGKAATMPYQDLMVPALLPGPKYGGSVFRMQNCTVGPKPKAAASNVIDMLTVLPTATKPRLACVVYTHKKARQAMRDSYATWGQDCDVFLPFSDEQFHDEEAGFTTIEVHPKSGNERDLIGKLNAIFGEVGRRASTNEIEFDFLTVSGDDSFWLLGNLKEYLRSDPQIQRLHTSGKGVYVGRRFAVNGNASRVFNSGAGYVIDRTALDTYLRGCPIDAQGWWEDVFIAQCLSRHGIAALPTEDGVAQRFNMFNPATMLSIDYKSGDWLESYSKPFPRARGLAGISRKSVLFHYVKGSLRYDLYNRLFFKANCEDTSIAQ